MEGEVIIETQRLLLRRWTEADRRPFAEMNGNADVMRYFPACMSAAESDAFVDRISAEIEEYGIGLFAVEVKGEGGGFAGFVGFHRFCFEAPFSPGWEIGWRLSDRYWKRGYAVEAASACMEYARSRRLFDRVYSFTAVPNEASERVMRRIGMKPAGRFMHPALPDVHPLKEHVLYVIDL